MGTQAGNRSDRQEVSTGNIDVRKQMRPVDARAVSLERAILALEDAMNHGDTIVPSAKWRRQYHTTAGLGLAVAKAITQHLTSSQHSIVQLNLHSLHIGDEGMALLAPALLQDSKIDTVTLSDNDLTDDIAQTLASLIGDSVTSHIRELVLSGNPISSVGLTALASALSRLPSLKYLELGCGEVDEDCVSEVDEQLTHQAVESLSALLASSRSIDTFVYKGSGRPIGEADFTPKGLQFFLNTALTVPTLSSLFLLDCFTTKAPSPVHSNGGKAKEADGVMHVADQPNIPNEDDDTIEVCRTEYLLPIRSLANGLRNPRSHLTTLAIRFPFTEEAMSLLCRGLSCAVKLANLSLRGCDLSAASLGILAKALEENSTISVLDVSYQSIIITHPVVLAQMRSSSERNRWPEPVCIDTHNSDSEQVAIKEAQKRPLLPLIKSLHRNRTLTRLLAIGITVTVDDIEEVCACIEQSDNRTIVEVSFSSLGCDAVSMKLDNFLAANRTYNPELTETSATMQQAHGGTSFPTLLNSDEHSESIRDRLTAFDSPNPAVLSRSVETASLTPQRPTDGGGDISPSWRAATMHLPHHSPLGSSQGLVSLKDVEFNR